MDGTNAVLIDDVAQLIQLLVCVGEETKVFRPHCQVLVPCLKLLQPVVAEIRDCSDESDVLFVLSLERSLERVKEVLDKANAEESRVSRVIRCQEIAKCFQDATAMLEEALKCIPLQALEISEGNQSQAEACIHELRRASYVPDISDLVLLNEIHMLLGEMRDKQHVQAEKLLKIFDKLGIASDNELTREMDALERAKERARLEKRKSDEELYERVLSMLTQVVRYSPDGFQMPVEQLAVTKNNVTIPADFRCPLCLELMGDPVIVASGQTYERAYIQQWLDQGNITCPKTRKVLPHTSLIPNYTVKALITNWCEANGVPVPSPAKLETALPMRKLSLIQRSAATAGGTRINIDTTEEEASFASNKASSSPMRLSKMGGGGSPPQQQGDWCFDGGSSPSAENRLLLPPLLLRVSPSGSSEDGVATPATIDASINLSDYSPCSSDISGDFERMASVLGGPVRRSPAAGLTTLERPHSFPGIKKMVPVRQRRTSSVPTTKSGGGSRGSARATSDGAVMVLVENLVEDLRAGDLGAQLSAARELRLLAKYDAENRIVIAAAGAVAPLVALLASPCADRKLTENAVTALLNLSIDDDNKAEIVAAGAVPELVRVLSGGAGEAVENAAAALFSLSILHENKAIIGASGAMAPLVELLRNGTVRGQKDAATALFNLSLLHENKATMVAAGAVGALVAAARDPSRGMVDKAVAVLANLMTVPEGRVAIGEEGGIPVLVEVVEAGSPRGKENAAAALLHLCTNSTRHRSMVLQEGAIPPLHALSQHGTPRAKEKAAALLRHFREQRHASFAAAGSRSNNF